MLERQMRELAGFSPVTGQSGVQEANTNSMEEGPSVELPLIVKKEDLRKVMSNEGGKSETSQDEFTED